MTFLIETIQKTRGGNLKVLFESDTLEVNFSKKLVTVTLDKTMTFSAKCSPIKIGEVEESRKYSGYFLVENETEISKVVNYYNFSYDMDEFITFEIPINQFIYDIIIEIRDGKDEKYRQKLFRQIYNLYAKLAYNYECDVDKVDELCKKNFGIESKKDLSTPDLETYRNKLLNLDNKQSDKEEMALSE